MSDVKLDRASPKDKNELLYGSSQELFKSLINYEGKHATILLIVAGWLMTAQRAQEVLESSPTLRLTITVVLILLTAVHSIWTVRFYLRSRSLFVLLTELAFMPEEYYRSVRVSPFFVVSFCLLHTVVTIAIIVIVWSLPVIVPSLSGKT